MTDTLEANPRAVEGGNNPPAPDPYEAHRINIEDLVLEARNWADATAVETEAQADEIARLVEELRLAVQAADASRIEENKPFDNGKAAVQAKYNLLIADTKTQTGSAVRAMAALKATEKPFRDKQEADKRALAEAARAEAQRVANEAAAALREAQDGDLLAQEAAEALATQAAQAARDATAAEKDKAPGLRKTWTPVLTDKRAAILHYMNAQPDAFVELVERLAVVDVREGKRQIPGFDVREGTKL